MDIRKLLLVGSVSAALALTMTGAALASSHQTDPAKEVLENESVEVEEDGEPAEAEEAAEAAENEAEDEAEDTDKADGEKDGSGEKDESDESGAESGN